MNLGACSRVVRGARRRGHGFGGVGSVLAAAVVAELTHAFYVVFPQVDGGFLVVLGFFPAQYATVLHVRPPVG